MVIKIKRNPLNKLLPYIDKLLDNLNNVDVVYLDFAKFFDKVDYRILLRNLNTLGIRGKLFKKIASFLINREQFIVANGALSLQSVLLSVVLWGEILFPIFFHIRDINCNMKSCKAFSLLMTLVVLKISTVQDIHNTQENLNSIYK